MLRGWPGVRGRGPQPGAPSVPSDSRHALLRSHHKRVASALPPHDKANVLLRVRVPGRPGPLHEALDGAVEADADVGIGTVVPQRQGAGHKVAGFAPSLELSFLGEAA